MAGCRKCGVAVHGTLGLARSLMNVGILSPGAVRQRLMICRTCVQSVKCRHNHHQVCRCNACGCWLKHKARLRDEACPHGRWRASR